ncbi:MAG: hypothetical protein J6B20_00330 [Clostridia bacterium]|nr:hypothetical protein [Clostridia bacterium]
MSKLQKLKNFIKAKAPEEIKKAPSQADNIYHDVAFEIDDLYGKIDFHRIYEALPVIFPDEKQIREDIIELDNLNNEQKKITQQNDCYDAKFLSYHLYDTPWLTNYVTKIVDEINFNKQPINVANVQSYIEKGKSFDFARNQYMARYIKEKIRHMMIKPEVDDLFIKRGFANYNHRIDCDEYFREVMRVMLTAQNKLPAHAVEVGLEKNANIWRKKTMLKAFNNYCNKIHLPVLSNNKVNLGMIELKNCIKSLRKVWLERREYDYYQKHKSIIDELGLATDTMKISTRAADKLSQQIIRYNHKILDFINQSTTVEKN